MTRPSLMHGLLAAVLLLGCLVRLPAFTAPPVDAHAMRQIDTDAVAYNFATHDPNILAPHNELIRPPTNTKADFLLEFPAYEWLLGLLYRLFGYHWAIARAFNLLLYVGTGLCLFSFVRWLRDAKTGLWAVLLYSFAPASIFFLGHAIHPDIFAVAMTMGSLAAYARFAERGRQRYFVLAVVALAVGVATRPFILIVYPAYLWLLWRQRAPWWQYLALSAGAMSLYGLWQLWIWHLGPAVDPSWEQWVLRGRETLLTYNGLVKRLLLKNVIGEVLGKALAALLVVALPVIILARKQLGATLVGFLGLWLAMIPVYWLIVPDGNLIHQYYADIYIAPVAIAAAVALGWGFQRLPRLAAGVLVSLSAGVVLFNGIHTATYFFTYITPTDVPMARQIATAVPPAAKLVYLGTNSVPASLAHRAGWVLGEAGIDVAGNADAILAMQASGARYVVAAKNDLTLAPDQMQRLQPHLRPVSTSDVATVYSFQ